MSPAGEAAGRFDFRYRKFKIQTVMVTKPQVRKGCHIQLGGGLKHFKCKRGVLLFLQGLKRTLHVLILLHQNHTHLQLKGGRQHLEGETFSAAAGCDSTPGGEGLFRIKKCLLGQHLKKIE